MDVWNELNAVLFKYKGQENNADTRNKIANELLSVIEPKVNVDIIYYHNNGTFTAELTVIGWQKKH